MVDSVDQHLHPSHVFAPFQLLPQSLGHELSNTDMDCLVIGNFVLERVAQARQTIPRTCEPVPD